VRREGEGASVGDLGWELLVAGRGMRPPPSRRLRLLREREAGVRGNWMPTANADAPTSLSRVLLLGLHRVGGSPDEVDLPPGGGVATKNRRQSNDPVIDGGCPGRGEEPAAPRPALRGKFLGLGKKRGDGMTPEQKRENYARWHSDKRCGRCSKLLPLEAFRPNPRSATGWSSYCRDCGAAANREWRERNRDAYNASRRVPPAKLECVECGKPFEGRSDRLVCSRRCKDRRYARHHPEQVKEKNRRHQADRRARARTRS